MKRTSTIAAVFGVGLVACFLVVVLLSFSCARARWDADRTALLWDPSPRCTSVTLSFRDVHGDLSFLPTWNIHYASPTGGRLHVSLSVGGRYPSLSGYSTEPEDWE